jgi:electron transfer flavoprotein beta subunit
MLAALWNRPQATFASKIELTAATAKVTREVDTGLGNHRGGSAGGHHH